MHHGQSQLTSVYAPSKKAILSWFHNMQIPADNDWLIVGDFNLIRSPSDRNKPSGNLNEMLAISASLRILSVKLNI
jgi:hypothetical protein